MPTTTSTVPADSAGAATVSDVSVQLTGVAAPPAPKVTDRTLQKVVPPKKPVPDTVTEVPPRDERVGARAVTLGGVT